MERLPIWLLEPLIKSLGIQIDLILPDKLFLYSLIPKFNQYFALQREQPQQTDRFRSYSRQYHVFETVPSVNAAQKIPTVT